MINPDAEPVAHHTPVPVPLHWQEDVKAGLDHDVSLGVLEPMPVGEPVTWCHQMVVCTKKNVKPHRTVDFQALNRHTTRETYHTQSPFHQAQLVPHNTKKTVFDCWNEYHSIPLHKDDYHLLSSPHGDNTITKQHHRATLHQGMAFREDLMRLFPMYQTKPKASTTPYFGQITSVTASPRQSTG